MNSEYFGRINSNGDVVILTIDDGAAVTRLAGVQGIYPVGSVVSTQHEHSAGIVLTQNDAKTIDIGIEGATESPNIIDCPRCNNRVTKPVYRCGCGFHFYSTYAYYKQCISRREALND